MRLVYLVRETTKQYTLEAWGNPEYAISRVESLNRSARREKKRHRFLVEVVNEMENNESVNSEGVEQ